MSDKSGPAKCKWCESKAERKTGHIWLCIKHYRFVCMRASAKSRRKSVPTYEMLEKMLPIDFCCSSCKRKMNWLSNLGTSTVITLQHDRSGAFRFLCLSCNVRHASMKDDAFYKVKPSFKFCSCCIQEKPKDDFYKRKGRWNGLNSYCKSCSLEKNKEWREVNRGKYNECHRRYRKNRRERQIA